MEILRKELKLSERSWLVGVGLGRDLNFELVPSLSLPLHHLRVKVHVQIDLLHPDATLYNFCNTLSLDSLNFSL